MSGNGKIICNHGVNLFKCQICIDALVAEQIELLEQNLRRSLRENEELKRKLSTVVRDDYSLPSDKFAGVP